MSKAKSTSTTGTTEVGEILYMNVARLSFNEQSKKEECGIKLLLPLGSASVEHLRSINSQKGIEVRNGKYVNGKNAGKDAIIAGKTVADGIIMNLTSGYLPEVFNADNQKLEGSNIPFFNGKTDTGKAAAVYKVITYQSGTQIVKLAGVKLLELNLAQRENDDSKSTSQIADDIAKITF